MTEEQITAELLDRDWTESDLRRAAAMLAMVDASPALRERVRELDAMRAAMRSEDEEAEPFGGWNAFEQRMLTHLQNAGAGSDRRLSVRWAPAASLALAAMVLIAVGAALWSAWFATPASMPAPHAVRPPAPSSFAAMSPSDREQQVQLFDQVAQVFGERAAWVATSDRVSDVGIGPVATADRYRLLILRLSVARDGKLLSRSDIAVVPGQNAELKVPFENGQQLRYLVSTTSGDHRQLALWIELNKPGVAQTVAALSTTLVTQPGQTVRAGELSTAAGDLRFDLGFYEAEQPARDGADHPLAPGVQPGI